MKYNVRADAQYDTSKKYYDEAFKNWKHATLVV